MTDQQAELLNQAHDMLVELAGEHRRKGNDSAAAGAECSADAVLKLAAGLLTALPAVPAVTMPMIEAARRSLRKSNNVVPAVYPMEAALSAALAAAPPAPAAAPAADPMAPCDRDTLRAALRDGLPLSTQQRSTLYDLLAAAPAEGARTTREHRAYLALTEQMIDEYLELYELRGEDESGADACYTPTADDVALIKDVVMGMIAEAWMSAAPTEAPDA